MIVHLDNYLSKTDYKIKKILFYGEKTPWTEQSSPDIQYNISIKNKAIKIDYQTGKAGAWTQISIDAQNKIHKNSIFYIKLKSTQDPNANLEIKIMAEDGSVFMKKILCKNLSKKWKNIKFRIKDFNYVWGGNNDIDKIKFLQIAIATLSKTSGSVSIKEIKKSNSN